MQSRYRRFRQLLQILRSGAGQACFLLLQNMGHVAAVFVYRAVCDIFCRAFAFDRQMDEVDILADNGAVVLLVLLQICGSFKKYCRHLSFPTRYAALLNKI